MATRIRPRNSAPTDGSRTITIQDSAPREEEELSTAPSSSHPTAGPSVNPEVLRLTGGPRSGPRVAWSEEVVDNEGCGRKKSKICCIYHKPKKFDESSDESSSDESDCGDGGGGHSHGHRHNHRGDTSSRDPGEGGSGAHQFHPDPGPNAYEVPQKRNLHSKQPQEPLTKE